MAKKIENVFFIGVQCVLTGCECKTLSCKTCNVPLWSESIINLAKSITTPTSFSAPVVEKVPEPEQTEPEPVIEQPKPKEKKKKEAEPTKKVVDEPVATEELVAEETAPTE